VPGGYHIYMNMTDEALPGQEVDTSGSDAKVKPRTKAEWMADHTAIFDAGPFKGDKSRRDDFLKRAERVFDQELENAWDGQFTVSGRSSTDDGSARDASLSEPNLQLHSNPLGYHRSAPRRVSAFAHTFVLLMAITLVAVLVYGYRYEISKLGDRLLATLMPSHGYSVDPETVSYFADANGQFWIRARANGIDFPFLVDTGATSIVFNKADARRLGFDPEVLRFDGIALTPNGRVRCAVVRLREVAIGQMVMRDVPALIDDGDLSYPLLGMEFLRRVSAIEIKNGTLTIHNNITPAEYRQRHVLPGGDPHDGLDPQPASPSDRLVQGGPFETPAPPPLNWSGSKSFR
jgi:clan AA aspartic protease (TIGR02281 family)